MGRIREPLIKRGVMLIRNIEAKKEYQKRLREDEELTRRQLEEMERSDLLRSISNDRSLRIHYVSYGDYRQNQR